MTSNQITVRVWGEWACFTRPEMKVERVSYPLMTPSAARGILEGIFWEPQIYYLVDSIRTVRRGRWTSFRRNEVTSRISVRNAREWMREPEKFTPIHAGGGAPDGTQRNMLALGDVEYIINAEVHLSALGEKANQPLKKYLDKLERHARTGKCFHRPYLGVREFAADFDWETSAHAGLARRAAELGTEYQTWDDELGLMLYDMFDADERATGFRWLSDDEMTTAHDEREQRLKTLKRSERSKLAKEPPGRTEGKLVAPQAAFFRASVRASVMDCHPSRIALIRQARTSEKGA